MHVLLEFFFWEHINRFVSVPFHAGTTLVWKSLQNISGQVLIKSLLVAMLFMLLKSICEPEYVISNFRIVFLLHYRLGVPYDFFFLGKKWKEQLRTDF